MCYRSEFPSLSGTSHPQRQNPSQAIWQQAVQQTPVQRPSQQQQQQPSNTQFPQQHHQQQSQPRQDLSSPNHDDMFIGSSHLQGSLDDYRRGQGVMGHMRQPQANSIEEFPPLGRNGTDPNDNDQRANLMQNTAYGAFSNTNAFSLQQNQAQARHGVPGAQGTQASSTRSSSAVERTMSPTVYDGW